MTILIPTRRTIPFTTFGPTTLSRLPCRAFGSKSRFEPIRVTSPTGLPCFFGIGPSPLLLNHVRPVITVSPKKEMIGTNALPVVTVMTDQEVVGDTTNVQLVAVAVDKGWLSSNRDHVTGMDPTVAKVRHVARDWSILVQSRQESDQRRDVLTGHNDLLSVSL